jgi:hypothetical protein
LTVAQQPSQPQPIQPGQPQQQPSQDQPGQPPAQQSQDDAAQLLADHGDAANTLGDVQKWLASTFAVRNHPYSHLVILSFCHS